MKNEHETNMMIPAQKLDGYWVESLDINDIQHHRSLSPHDTQKNTSLRLMKSAEIFDKSQQLNNDLDKMCSIFEDYVDEASPETLPSLSKAESLFIQDVKGRYDHLQVNLKLFEHHLKKRGDSSSLIQEKTEEEIMDIDRKKLQLIQSESHERIDVMKHFAKNTYLHTREVQDFIRETIKRSKIYQGVIMELNQRYSFTQDGSASTFEERNLNEDRILGIVNSLFEAESAAQLRRIYADLQPSAVAQLLF